MKAIPEQITRANVDLMIDAHRIEIAMATGGKPNGRWWAIRRNGATQRWKRDANRIRIPYKYGMYGYGSITESDFVDGVLDPTFYRIKSE